MRTIERAVGAVLGSAVGDALGAPFEFGLPGVFHERFPDGAGAMCGGGGWDPGEATDDTQMAVLVGESLLDQGGLDLPDVFDRFRRWAASEPKDIGLQTEDVLTSGDPWDTAAALPSTSPCRASATGSCAPRTCGTWPPVCSPPPPHAPEPATARPRRVRRRLAGGGRTRQRPGARTPHRPGSSRVSAFGSLLHQWP